MWIQLTQPWNTKPAGEKIYLDPEDGQKLLDQKIAVPIDDPTPALFQGALDAASARFSKQLDQAITAALDRFQTAQSQARRHAVPAIFGDNTSGDTKKCFGDWLAAVARADRKYLETHYNSEFVSYTAKAAMGEASGITGGYIVPPEFSQQLLALISEKSVMRPNAFIQPMASATLQLPYLDVTTAQAAGTSPFFGGVKFNWTEEAQTRTETEPGFKMLELKAHELSGYAVSSNVLLQDAAFGLEKFLMSLFSQATAWYEDYAFIQGNGVGKPMGLVKASCGLDFKRAARRYVGCAKSARQCQELPASARTRFFQVLLAPGGV
jgi:HK97 family phage major capsid protein